MAGGLARNPGEDARRMLAQALRPFILRRTKQQVARELPEKTEQTIYCELEGPQRKQYDELRKHYRETLLARVQTQGMGKSKMHVLEALLRLRQAACHPGLLDAKRVRRAQRQAGRAAGPAGRAAAGGAQGAGVLAVHQPAGHRARPPGRRGRHATNTWTAPRATARRTWTPFRTIRSAACS